MHGPGEGGPTISPPHLFWKGNGVNEYWQEGIQDILGGLADFFNPGADHLSLGSGFSAELGNINTFSPSEPVPP